MLLVRSLWKVFNDNMMYYGYGIWDSDSDLMDHFYSTHIMKLREFAAYNDITWFMMPMVSASLPQ